MRECPERGDVPVLILSGDADPANVDRAYALGANSYVLKSSRVRSMSKVIATLYDHWLTDARLPGSSGGPTRRLLALAVRIRSRYAMLYLRMAEELGRIGVDTTFWIDLALKQGNLANLFAFLRRQLGDYELPQEVLAEWRVRQGGMLATVAAIEAELDLQPLRSEGQACRWMLLLSAGFDPEQFARSASLLFPVGPTAMSALRDLVAREFDDIAAWVDDNVSDEELQSQAFDLRDHATKLRMLLPRHPAFASCGAWSVSW